MRNLPPRKANSERLEQFASSAFRKVGVPVSDADLADAVAASRTFTREARER